MRKFSFFRRKSDQEKWLLRISIYAFIVLALLILFEKVIGHLPALSFSLVTGVQRFSSLISPFIMGFAIAYVMNPFINFFERKLLKYVSFFDKHRKLTRTVSILINYVIIIGGTIWIIIYLLPEIKDSIMAFTTNVPVYTVTMNNRIQIIFDQISFIDSKDVNNALNHMLLPLQNASQNAPEILEAIVDNIFNVGRITLNFIMALFIAFYMVYDKEGFSRQLYKIVYAVSNEEKAERFLHTVNRIHHIFQSFIVGKAIDSLIIGILAMIGLTLIKAPFPLILSLIIGVTNMIPYFGPFIGAIPAIFITLLIDPPLGVIVGLFILVLQQFDGNFLGPKILGDSLDLSPLWIIMAVVVGGATMGPLGMFIGVPIFATIKTFCGEYISRLYWKKYDSSNPLALSKEDTDAP